MEIKISKKIYDEIVSCFRSNSSEQVIFLYMEPVDGAWQAAEIFVVPKDDLVFESTYHAEITDEVQAAVMKKAAQKEYALCEIHSHPFDGDAAFSSSDLYGLSQFVPYAKWRLDSKPYFALVFGRSNFDALAWLEKPESPIGIDVVEVGGAELKPTGITINYLNNHGKRKSLY